MTCCNENEPTAVAANGCNCHNCDCEEALARLCEYLDAECADIDFDRLKRHFEACAPCLTEYNLTVSVKTALKRACDCEAAPVELRETIRASITTWCIETPGA